MSDTVNKRSAVMAAMIEASAKGRALSAGTDAMRKGAEQFLPKFKAELKEDYDARLQTSWLFNGLGKTVKDMTGKVFSKPVTISKGPSRIVDEWQKDINMQGQDLSTFAKEVFQDGFIPGVSYIMVDAPRREVETTREQANTQGLRPYLVHLTVEDVLGFKTEMFNNVLSLSMLRISETVHEDDPKDEFTQIKTEQIRVLTRLEGVVSVRIYRENDKKKWLIYDQYLTNAQEITVIPFYAQRTGFFTGEPVLNDLADVNIAHWGKQSDYDNISHVANVAILHISGRRADEGDIVISPATAITSEDPDAKMEYVEHKGHAIGALERGLLRLENQMQALGLQLLVESNETATGATLDAKKETSTLAMMADNLKDALEQALEWMAFYGGLDESVIEVEVNKEFGVAPLTAQEIQVMQMDVQLGLFSEVAYYEERKRRGFINPDLSTEEDMDAVAKQSPKLEGEALDLTGPSGVDAALAALNG